MGKLHIVATNTFEIQKKMSEEKKFSIKSLFVLIQTPATRTKKRGGWHLIATSIYKDVYTNSTSITCSKSKGAHREEQEQATTPNKNIYESIFSKLPNLWSITRSRLWWARRQPVRGATASRTRACICITIFSRLTVAATATTWPIPRETRRAICSSIKCRSPIITRWRAWCCWATFCRNKAHNMNLRSAKSKIPQQDKNMVFHKPKPAEMKE